MVIKETDIIQRICSMDCSAKLRGEIPCPCGQMKDIAKDIIAFFKVKVLERAEDAPEFMQYDDCKEWMAGMFTEVVVEPQPNHCTKPDGCEPCKDQGKCEALYYENGVAQPCSWWRPESTEQKANASKP